MLCLCGGMPITGSNNAKQEGDGKMIDNSKRHTYTNISGNTEMEIKGIVNTYLEKCGKYPEMDVLGFYMCAIANILVLTGKSESEIAAIINWFEEAVMETYNKKQEKK